jgi:DNA-binding HxlR family transcriptional regulator
MYCPIARALDVLGERWTLLILRELALGERRFTDLKRSVAGIPPNVLSARLKALRADGLVDTLELPPPVARTVYVLTDRGREAFPVLRALAKWGFPMLEEARPDTQVKPISVVASMYIPYYDRRAAEGIDERYSLTIDGEPFRLSSVAGDRAVGDRPADLALDGPAWAFVAARQGPRSLGRLVDDGVIDRTTGSARTLRNFERVFALRG